MCNFWAQNSPFVLNKIFLVQTIVITFIYLLALFIVQNLKKYSYRKCSYDDSLFFSPKWSTCHKQFFFSELLISFVSIYQPLSLCKSFKNSSCLSTCKKSKPDINLLVKYWWLKDTEISLTESHFDYNIRTRFFPSMQAIFSEC